MTTPYSPAHPARAGVRPVQINNRTMNNLHAITYKIASSRATRGLAMTRTQHLRNAQRTRTLLREQRIDDGARAVAIPPAIGEGMPQLIKTTVAEQDL